jgi:hypothetical protein
MKRVILLLVLFIVCLPVLGLGQQTVNPPSLITADANAHPLTLPQSDSAQWRLLTPRPRADMMRGPETCLTMRTYIFAARRDSDRTRLVGQTTCTPSRAFALKSAIETLPARR